MIDQLDPNDNHGLRDLLMRDYLQGGDIERAIALGDRFPDDLGAMRYNRALAYFRAGRKSQADIILANALNAYPLIGKILLTKRVAKPKGHAAVIIGSREEAILYRVEYLPFWPADALDWLAAARKH